MSEQETFDVAVVGAGPAGLITGLSCAAAGLRTAVIGPRADIRDGRTAALLDGSITLLKRLGVWSAVEGSSAPLTAIRLVDATGGLVRAPEVLFEAREIGLAAFGSNVPNTALTRALEDACSGRLTRIESRGVSGFSFRTANANLATQEGAAVTALLVAAADGRGSPTREAAGISVSRWAYDQAALVTTFAHARPHRGISTELHRRAGPLTVVPSPGDTASLVWVETAEEASRLAALGDEDFARILETHLGGLLGRISGLSPRRTYPLAAQTAAVMGRNRVALIGEAGHVVPPIGAQGLNLGFRDAATLADVAGEAKLRGDDPGGEDVLSRYAQLRKGDIASRVFGVDALNRMLLSSWVPGVHLARGLGLFALASSGALRARVMREGVMPGGVPPTLMRPVAADGEMLGAGA